MQKSTLRSEQNIQICKGLDLPFLGDPIHRVTPQAVKKVALLGVDFIGLKPKILVQEGDKVRVGTPLLLDKRLLASAGETQVNYCSSASGKVVAINRGERRALLSIEIELDGKQEQEKISLPKGKIENLSVDEVKRVMAKSGVWTAFRTRPFSKVPALAAVANSIFVTATDSNPLSAKPLFIIGKHQAEFLAGLIVLAKLAKVNVCTSELLDLADIQNVQQHLFNGVHPAGLVGTHIHYIDSIGFGNKSVWTIGYQEVIAIGVLFTQSKLWNERYYAVAGPCVADPQVILTNQGACTTELVAERLTMEADKVRVISGSPLCGNTAEGALAFVGRYHNQVCVLEEGYERPALHYLQLGCKRFSKLPIYISSFFKGKKWSFTTTLNGSDRAMVPIGIYDEVMPLDILPVQLLRALIVGDTKSAIELGALELEEEDLALCTYVCPGKYNYGKILRECLKEIEQCTD